MRAYIDYLRLASWDSGIYTKLVSKVRLLEKGWRVGNWLQYKGWKSPHYFYGVGLQNKQRHHIVQCSGEESHMFAQHAQNYARFYASRIDLQVTIEEPDDYNALEVYNDVRNISGNTRAASIILSDTGSTVYFGNRTSDTFARLYQKEIDEKPFLRLEIEIKGITARQAWENIRTEQTKASSVYLHMFERFKLPENVREWFLSLPNANDEFVTYDHLRYKNNKLQWLMSLQSTIIKMGNDHATGSAVKTMLENCLERIDDNTP